MGLFSKNDSTPPVKTNSSNEAISSVICKNMRITGELHFTGKARIDGTIEGNIKGEHLILSDTGRVKGDLELISLVCHGSVEGNIKAQEVTVHAKSNIHGNLAAENLSVEPGAKLSGEISAASQQSQIKAVPPNKAADKEKNAA